MNDLQIDLEYLTVASGGRKSEEFSDIVSLRNFLRKDLKNLVRFACKRQKYKAGRIQLTLADAFQDSTATKMIQCFRGASKSFICDLYILWRWLRCPDTKVLILGAKEWNAKKHIRSLSMLMKSMAPVFDHLQIAKSIENGFQLACATVENDLSVYATGIFSAIESSRSDLVIIDDSETKINAVTESLREKLRRRFSEVQAILHPACRHIAAFVDLPLDHPSLKAMPENCQAIYIGTPKSEFSVYNVNDESNHPLKDALKLVIPALSKNNRSTFPERFSTENMFQKRSMMSSPDWYLEMMLDPTLLDKANAVLKLDSIAEEKIDAKNVYETIMTVDPVGDSGTGKDEGAICVSSRRKDRNAVHVKEIQGFKNTTGNDFVNRTLDIAKAHGVRTILVESNFNAYLSLYQRAMNEKGNFAVILPLKSTTRKLDRLIETLEIPINSGLVTFDPGVLANKDTLIQFKTFTFGALPEPNDRIDSLSMSLAYWDQQGVFSSSKTFKVEVANREFSY